jgi:hypothetical protein
VPVCCPGAQQVNRAKCHFAVYVRRSPRASATVLLTGILPASMAFTLGRSILHRLASVHLLSTLWSQTSRRCPHRSMMKTGRHTNQRCQYMFDGRTLVGIVLQ